MEGVNLTNTTLNYELSGPYKTFFYPNLNRNCDFTRTKKKVDRKNARSNFH